MELVTTNDRDERRIDLDLILSSSLLRLTEEQYRQTALDVMYLLRSFLLLGDAS
jgi:hypothetical protein